MSEGQVLFGSGARADAGGRMRRFVAGTGVFTLDVLRRFAQTASLGSAIIFYGLRPSTWRRTVRTEFVRRGFQVGVKALPSTMVAAVLIGLAMVFQALYWLDLAGQLGFIGRFLVLGLIREIAPVLVGLVVIGRSGTVTVMELAKMRAEHEVHMLQAQGIDPFAYLVVPRVVALSIAVFSLTVAFIVVALGAGYFAANAAGVADMSLLDFTDSVLGAMGAAEYALVLFKTLSIGFVVGVVSCITALGSGESDVAIDELVPRGFMRAVLATFIISGVWSLLL